MLICKYVNFVKYFCNLIGFVECGCINFFFINFNKLKCLYFIMRNDLIDILRGFAFILMLVHHFFSFNPNDDFIPTIVNICGIISRTIFIILVGASIQMFKDKKKNQ